jgi:peptide/nickel transport system substrate-binding protein
MRVHNRSRRVLAAAVAAGACLALVAGCASSSADSGDNGGSTDGQDKTLVFGASADPQVIYGPYVSDGESLRVIDQIFETLVTLKPGTTEVEPALAESWSASSDGLDWTFKLRQGVKFQDGTDFNGDAVCFNFNRWYNFKGAAQSSNLTYYWQVVFGGFATRDDDSVPETSIYKSCDAPDANTAVIHLNSPNSSFLPALVIPAFSIASPTALDKYGDGVEVNGDSVSFTGTFGTEHPIGTGPYSFKSWTPGDKLELVRNDDYWGDKAKIKTLIFKPIADGPARKQALESGDIDGYDFVAPEDLTAMQASYQVLERPAFNVGYLGMNQNSGDLGNLKFRQAIAYSLDRESLLKAKYPPGSEVATQFMPPTLWGWNPDVVTYPYDPDKAKQMLAESGVKNPSVEFWYPSGVSRPYMPDPTAVFQAFKANLEAVGIKVVPKTAAWTPDYLKAVQEDGKAGIYLLGWTGDWADPSNFIGTFFGRADTPDWGYTNPAVQDGLKAALQEPDQAKREQMYKDLNAQIMKDLPGVPFVHNKSYLAFQTNVTGFTPSPVSLERFDTVDITTG